MLLRNHAQGVAFAAQELNIKASIFMPATTPEIKVNAVKSLVQMCFYLATHMMMLMKSHVIIFLKKVVSIYIHLMMKILQAKGLLQKKY